MISDSWKTGATTELSGNVHKLVKKRCSPKIVVLGYGGKIPILREKGTLKKLLTIDCEIYESSMVVPHPSYGLLTLHQSIAELSHSRRARREHHGKTIW